MYKKDVIVLENTQRRTTKIVNLSFNLPYEERLKQLWLPTLEYRRLRADVIEVYKIINQYDQININKFFTIMDNTTTRSNSIKLYKRRSRLNVRANIFSNREVNVWSSLPKEAVLAPSVNAFMSRPDKHWNGHERKISLASYILCELQ